MFLRMKKAGHDYEKKQTQMIYVLKIFASILNLH